MSAVLSRSVVSNSLPPHRVSRQAPLSLRILQARILEWVAMPSSRGSSQPRDRTQVSCTASDSSPSEPPGKPSMNSMPCELETHGDISCWHQNLWCCGDLCLSSKDFFIKLSSSVWRKRMHMIRLLWFGGFAECRGQNGKKEGVMGIEKMKQEVGEEERPGPWWDSRCAALCV